MLQVTKESLDRDKELRAHKIRLEKMDEKDTVQSKQQWKRQIRNWQKEYQVIGFTAEFDNAAKTANIKTILEAFAREENLEAKKTEISGWPTVKTFSKEGSRYIEGDQNSGFKFPQIIFSTEELGRKFGLWLITKHVEGDRAGSVLLAKKDGEQAMKWEGGKEVPVRLVVERVVETNTVPHAALGALQTLKKSWRRRCNFTQRGRAKKKNT